MASKFCKSLALVACTSLLSVDAFETGKLSRPMQQHLNEADMYERLTPVTVNTGLSKKYQNQLWNIRSESGCTETGPIYYCDDYDDGFIISASV